MEITIFGVLEVSKSKEGTSLSLLFQYPLYSFDKPSSR
jgi:hypothetical protein